MQLIQLLLLELVYRILNQRHRSAMNFAVLQSFSSAFLSYFPINDLTLRFPHLPRASLIGYPKRLMTTAFELGYLNALDHHPLVLYTFLSDLINEPKEPPLYLVTLREVSLWLHLRKIQPILTVLSKRSRGSSLLRFL